ncbi:hypothetical protein TWF191_003186 [Orbilia oligospora]|uniref:Uncharacterized protein n=3 Tax=Orbilia oligospora TaxID=2813651 RepID=A0A7C8Q8E5_ORBOL|nr:hypothetical protein TWF191_003186 [Orbilia oligospora]
MGVEDMEPGPLATAAATEADEAAEDTTPQTQPPELSNSPFLFLPCEMMLEIAGYLHDSTPGQDSKILNSLSQTCHHLRQIFYPLANRHLWYDEETQFPDTLLKLVLYTLTEPLAQHVGSATFRFQKETSFWFRDEYDEFIEEGLAKLKLYLAQRAEYGEDEVFKYLESKVDEYGMYILPTVILFQLKDLREIELAPSIHAMSSKFMLTTLHYFEPPFQLNRLGMVRLTDLAPVNYWMLERFLRLGPLQSLGIDYRFGSTRGRPKIRPIEEFYEDAEETWKPHLESESEDDISVWSLNSEEEDMSIWGRPQRGNGQGNASVRTVEQDIDDYHQGYQSAGWQEAWYPTEISYELPGADEPTDTDKFQVQDLRLWMDEIPSIYEKLIPLLHKITGLRRFDLNLFAMWGSPALGPVDAPNTRDFKCIMKLLENHQDTLESLTIRIAPLSIPRSIMEPLLGFSHLRKVHIFCTTAMIHAFQTDVEDECFFSFMFPPSLEILRMDFCSSEKLIEKAMDIWAADFPRLKVVLSIFREESVHAEMRKQIQKLWDSMPYRQDSNSGLWEELETIEPSEAETAQDTNPTPPAGYQWRRRSNSHVPVQLMIVLEGQRNVWCSQEGWYGPFQEHPPCDQPWDIDAFNAIEPWTHDSEADENDYSRFDPHAEPWIGTPLSDIVEMRL